MNEMQAKTRLEEAIHTGMQSANATIQRVLSVSPKDQLVSSHTLEFASNGHVYVDVRKDERFSIHNHALYQFAERAAIPRKFVENFVEEDWRRPILAEAMTRTYFDMPRKRFLSRSVDGEIRGFLSDRFRRLDARPLLDTFAQAIQQAGAVPYKGAYDDIRVSVKAIIPEIYEIYPGEWAAIGMDWRNSDFGAGANDARLMLLRVVCINGMVGMEALREIHLGKQLDDNIEWSNETYRLDTERSQNMLKDAVENFLGDEKVNQLLDGVKKAAETETSWAAVSKKLKGSLTKKELERAKEAFEGPDVVNLPEGRSLWRASNALSWMVHSTESVERSLQLERLAGQLVEAA